MLIKDFVIADVKTSLEDLLNRGLTFKQANNVLLNGDRRYIYFSEFMDGIPALNSMFREFIDDEASGAISNLRTFKTAFDDYFGLWGWGETEVENEEITEEELEEDIETIRNYIWNNYKDIADYLEI